MNRAEDILKKVARWPQEDQQELAGFAREIEARRTGIYALSADERAAIAESREGAFASDEDARLFWSRHGIG